jgi:hypothetical protein
MRNEILAFAPLMNAVENVQSGLNGLLFAADALHTSGCSRWEVVSHLSVPRIWKGLALLSKAFAGRIPAAPLLSGPLE